MGSTSHLQMMGCLGKHGPYTFYKSIKIGDRVLSLATFMPVKIWPDMEFLSIADIQLIWTDKNNESLCSLRLYFLPENTPDGRLNQHGEDEVVALRDRVVVKASDLSSWLVPDTDWKWGLKAPLTVSNKSIHTRLSKSFVAGDEKYKLNNEEGVNSVVVLSYSRYIRLRTVLKRLEGTSEINEWLSNPAVLAIGGLNVGPESRILYTKEVIEVPELEFHELLCNHLAPKRISKTKRRKKKVRNLSQGSNSTTSDSMSVESDESERTKRANGILTPPLPKAVDIKPFVPSASKRASQTSNDQIAFNLSKTVQDILSAFSTNGGLEISKVDPRTWGNSGDITGGRKRLGSNGSSENVEDLQRLLGKLVSANQELESPYGLCDPKLGSSLEELALKLRKSNALQISPIRPSVIGQQDSMGDGDVDNHIGIKRVKTEDSYSRQDNLNSARARDFGSSSLNRNSIPKSSRNKSGLRHDVRPVSPTQVSKKRSQTDQTALLAQLPVMHLPGTSPSPFASTKKIYGDPYEYKKQNTPTGHYSKSLVVDVDNIVDLASSKRNNTTTKKIPHRPAMNQAPKFDKPSGLLDRCSTQHVSSNQSMFPGISGIPPPNAMNQHGLQLTSEVTLYPSQSPSNAKAKTSSSSQRIGNNMQSNNKPSAAVQNPHITIQQSSRSGRPSTSTPTTSSGPPPMSLPFGNIGADMNALQAFMQSAGNSNGLQASHAALAMAGYLERPDGEAAVTINPYFAPSLYGKMDPSVYLSLLGSNMYPSGLMMMPGAMEQLYKDLMEQDRQRSANLANLPPGNWFLPHGKDRGNKS